MAAPLHARLLPLPLPPNPIPGPGLPASGARRVPRPPRRHGHRRCLATPPSRNGSSSSPETEWCPVPPEQRPVNEYEALAASLPFSWAAGDLRVYCSRLALTGAAVALFVGFPVAAFGGRGGAGADALHLALGATGSGILAVTLAVVRMYLGWAYVGNRLLSATVEYEETGWYDGQIWVKTPEVLARDRLLGSFSVKPVLNRVKFTLVGLAGSLILCILLYVNTENPKEPDGNTGGRAIPGVYSDTAARSFEPDAFCGQPGQPVRLADSYRCWFVKNYCWLVCVREKYCSGWKFTIVYDKPQPNEHAVIYRSMAKCGAWKVFRWWYMVSQGIQVPLCLSALAFVNGGCFHFCTK